MELECRHLSISMSDKQKMKNFYVDKLGMELLDEEENFFACRAGMVRFSFFAGARKYPVNEDSTGISVVLRTGNIEQAKKLLESKGVKFLSEIEEAPGFMKYAGLEDPDNNLIYIAEYFREPV